MNERKCRSCGTNITETEYNLLRKWSKGMYPRDRTGYSVTASDKKGFCSDNCCKTQIISNHYRWLGMGIIYD